MVKPATPPTEPEVERSSGSLDALKLNFDMTKQVMSTTAIIIPLLLLFLRSDQPRPHPPLLAKFALGLLLASLAFGMLLMGRLIANAEESRNHSLEKAAQWLAMLQQIGFFFGMTLIAGLLFAS